MGKKIMYNQNIDYKFFELIKVLLDYQNFISLRNLFELAKMSKKTVKQIIDKYNDVFEIKNVPPNRTYVGLIHESSQVKKFIFLMKHFG